MIFPDEDYSVSEKQHALPHKMTSTLIVREAKEDHKGTYECIAKNSLGVAKSSIRTYSKSISNTYSGRRLME